MLQDSLKDLIIGERAIDRMATTTTYSELYEAWEDYLIRIERAWERAHRAVKKKNGFQQWFKPYAKLRDDDPLLNYLRHARSAETHAISKTLDKPIQLLVRDKLGRPFGVNNVQYKLNDGVLDIHIDTPESDLLLDYGVSVIPTDPHLVRFKNRGVWYELPSTHLGNPIRIFHPVVIARMGLAFYRGFIEEAMNYFRENTKK